MHIPEALLGIHLPHYLTREGGVLNCNCRRHAPRLGMMRAMHASMKDNLAWSIDTKLNMIHLYLINDAATLDDDFASVV